MVLFNSPQDICITYTILTSLKDLTCTPVSITSPAISPPGFTAIIVMILTRLIQYSHFFYCSTIHISVPGIKGS